MIKKIFLLLFLMSFGTVCNTQEIVVPNWSDYCPARYLNAKPMSYKEYQKLQKYKYIPVLPNVYKEYNKKAAYWSDRKVKFDRFVEICAKEFPNSQKGSCYKRIEEREMRLNNKLKDDMKQFVNTNRIYGPQMPPGSMPSTQNMLRNMLGPIY